MKKMKSRLMAGLLSMTMVFSVTAMPTKVLAATDTSGHWAESSINNWIGKGYVSGYPDGTFRPDNPISRAEFVTMANKAFGFTSSQGISFSDVKPGYWAYSEIQKGVAAGYIQGDASGTFRPGSAVSRQEAAVMLAKLRGYSNDEAGAYNYTDRWAMANWAVGAIGAVSRSGIMSGYPDNTFKPQKAMTRAEAVSSLQKVANAPSTTNNNSYTTSPVYVTPGNNNTNSNSNTNSNTTSSSFQGTVLEGTTLENRTFTKDLLIPSSVGRETVTLKNIRMKGTLYVEGGSDIILDNCNIGKVIMAKTNAVLKNNGNSDIEEVYFEEEGRLNGKGYSNVIIDDNSVDEVIIDASVDNLKLDAEVDVKLYANADIDTFEITKRADNARISIGEDAEVMDMQIYDKVRISGKGKIDTMTVYVSGVKSEIEPRRLIQQDNAKKPNFSYDSSDDDDDDDNDYDNLTLSDDDENFDGDGDKYDRVKIDAEDVDVSDLTAYGDLTITSAAGNSTIRLKNVTAKKNVYIEGGGDSSVIFEDCDIKGNIYSRKNTSGKNDEAVAIKLRDTPVDGDVYISGDTLLESDKKLNKIAINKELSKPVEISASAKNIIVEKNNTVQIKSGSTIDNMEVSAGLNDVDITLNGGKITTLTARSPIKLEGTGTVDKLLTNQTNDISSNITIGSTGTIDGDGNGSVTSYTIAASASGSGTISPSGEQIVASGTEKAFTMTAASENHISSITVDGKAIDLGGKLYSGYTYTFKNVKANHEIIVYFAAGAGTDGNGNSSTGGNEPSDPNATEFVITAKAAANGGIDPSGEVTVQKGGEQKFTITTTDTADTKYHIDTVKIDGEELIRVNERNYAKFEYTFKDVQAPHTIEATFAEGAGTGTGSMDSTMDNTSGNTGEDGYYYNIDADLYYSSGDKLYDKNGIYYCVAGETVQLKTESIDTNDPKYADGKLQLKWTLGGTSTGIKAEISETDEYGNATLTTTSGSGYAVMLNLALYDKEKGNKIEGSGIEPISLHVDVPLNNGNGGSAQDGLVLTIDGSGTSLWTEGYTFNLVSPSYVFNPTNATIAKQSDAKEQITWEIDEANTKIDGWNTYGSDRMYIDVGSQNNKVYKTLIVEHKDEKGNIIQTPSGYVTVTATVPNGLGKGQDYVKDFKIEFTGGKFIPVTEILLPESPKPYEFAAVEGITSINLNDIFKDSDDVKNNIFVSPGNATNKTVEWKILDTDSTLKEETSLGKIVADTNEAKTILETKGVPGEIKLKAYVKNGKTENTDFTTGEKVDAEVTVSTAEVTVTGGTDAKEGVNTDEGNTFTLWAKTEGNSPYTTVTKWQKREFKEQQADDAGWTDVSQGITEPVWDKNENRWESTYTVQAGDLDSDKYNKGKAWEFRAVVPQDDTNVIYSTPIRVTCKGIPSTIQFPTQTDGKKTITGSGSQASPYTITGFDKVTLPTNASTGKDIQWQLSISDDSVAKLDGNSLTVKGKDKQNFTLTAQVTGEITTTYYIQTVFEPIDKENSSFSVVDEDDLEVSTARAGQKIYLKEGNVQISPATASYYGYDDSEMTWRIAESSSESGEKITLGSNGEYTIPDKYKGKTIYITVVWKNGTKGQNENPQSLQSNPVEIQIAGDTTVVPVTGIDFSEVKVNDTPIAITGDGTKGYTATVTGSADNDININLALAKKQPSTPTSQENIAWSISNSPNADVATFNDNIVTIKQGNKAGKMKLQATVTNGVSVGVPYLTTLELDIQAASASTPTAPTFVAVNDISFSNITGLKAPISPATEYTATSKSSENVVLNLQDTTATVDGVGSVRNGAKVLPETATHQQIVWKFKDGTQTTQGATKNLISITNIATLDTDKNTVTILPNASGSFTLVATVKNGKEEQGSDTDFTKELTIKISAPTQTATITPQQKNINTGGDMPALPDGSENNHVNTGADMTQASKKQVVSVGTTEVGGSSVSSAKTKDSDKNENGYAAHVPNNTPNTDVKIEVVGQCKKGSRIPLKAISKTTGKEYTDVEWEVTDDNHTDSKIVNGNKLKAENAGVVTVTATVYTPSGEKWLRSINVIISN